jgi:hypothetical protein
MALFMKTMLIFLVALSLSSCISSTILIGCGVTAINMPKDDAVGFSAEVSVETASGIVRDTRVYTCRVTETKCIGGDWRQVFEETPLPPFNIKLNDDYHATITTPSCRISANMVKSDTNGYTEIITVFDSKTAQQVYRATEANSDLQRYGFRSLAVTVSPALSTQQ